MMGEVAQGDERSVGVFVGKGVSEKKAVSARDGERRTIRAELFIAS